MYDRRIEGKEYTFGVSGKLINNILVMYDHQTDSSWPQILGEAIAGKLQGSRLKAVPSVQTDWAAWKAQHPQGKVLSKRDAPYGASAYLSDVYEGYYASGQTGIVPLARRSTLLGQKERVIGLEIQGRAKAYPFRKFQEARVVNDTLRDTPLVVVYHPGGPSAAIFQRQVGGKALTFEPQKPEAQTPVMVDKETGTRWSGITGEALEGALKGERLQVLPSTIAFWFGWFNFFPDTEVFGS